MTKYDRSKQEVAKLAAILRNGESLPEHAESQSLSTLVRTGFHTMLNIVKKQKEEITAHCVNQGTRISQAFEDDLDQTENAINEIVLACHQQSLADQGIDILDRPLISSFYDFEDPVYTERVVQESAIRGIPMFLGDKDPSDIYMEQLLVHINQVGLQLKLNEAGLISVLFKRLGGKALNVIQSQMQLLGLSMDRIMFKQLVSLCENSYMKNSTPRAAKLALHHMKKLTPTSRNYMELEASIVRLARLSCRDVLDDKEREILFKSRSLEQFLACLQPHDKALLDKQNTSRLNAGLDFLTLHASVQALENHYRDADVEKTPMLEYNDSSVNRVSNDDGCPYPSQEVMSETQEQFAHWVQRGNVDRGRYNSHRGNVHSRGQFRGAYGQRTPTFRPTFPTPRGAIGRGQYHQFGPRQYSTRPRYGGYNNPRGHRPMVPVQQIEGQGTTGRKTPMDKNVRYSHEKLNIVDKGCFLCGVPGHRWTDIVCVYHGTPLCETPCRRCGQAGHLTKLCIGPIQAAVSALKRQKDNAKQVQNRHGHYEMDTSDKDVGNLEELLDQLDMEN